jgi:hypothetical protein
MALTSGKSVFPATGKHGKVRTPDQARAWANRRCPQRNKTTGMEFSVLPQGSRKHRGPVMFVGRRLPKHRVAVHPDNVLNKDWIILLEAGTIIGPSPQRFRVASATQERKVKKKRRLFARPSYFLVLEEYNPRVHAVYFCPQLYRYDPNEKLIALTGDEIGSYVAQAIESAVTERQPWYEPSEQLPKEPVIKGPMMKELDTVVVEMADARNAKAAS